MKLVIPSAGIGSRLGEYTKNFNKGLVTIGNQPAIIRIINNITKEFDVNEVIVLTGYQAELLEEVIFHFCNNINIKVIRVDKFTGEGSSLTHTLKHARDLLQTNFIFCANDTLCSLPSEVHNVSDNWMAFYKKRTGDLYQPRNYRTIEINNQSEVTNIYPKDYGNDNIYVGMAYIHDYRNFWFALEKSEYLIGEVTGLSALKKVNAIEVTQWHDFGMISSLNRAKSDFKQSEITVLEKENEAIWFVDNLVVKQHVDAKFISDRIKRLDYLPRNFVPNIKDIKVHSFSYNLIQGKVITDILDERMLVRLLDQMHSKMWTRKVLDKEKIYSLKTKAISFYKEKTINRVQQYFTQNERRDTQIIINGKYCEPIFDILQKIDWKSFLSKSEFAWFHGDFHNENILSDGTIFTLIDWRQNFSEGEYEFGDVYYDLAKFQHGLLVSHPIVDKGLFSVEYSASSEVSLEIHQSSRLLEINTLFEAWLVDKGYCLPKVRLITALIYLNIAVLHKQPYGEFLFFYGCLLLQKQLDCPNSLYFKK